MRTVPGIGTRTAEAFVAYVDDVRRFARTKQVGCYLGLVPCQDQSAGLLTEPGPELLSGTPTNRTGRCRIDAWAATVSRRPC